MSRTFVFGDIHGCYDEFITLLERLKITLQDTIVCVGDIIDRGEKSVEVYHYFKNTPNAITLMGNHERKHLKGILSYAQEIVKLQMGDEYNKFLEWATTLPYYHQTPEAIIVHAAFEHDVLLNKQKEEVLCGSTSGARYLEKKYPEGTYWSDYYDGEKPIVYGHHVVGEKVKVHNNTYGIDTGACHGDYLTVLELPGFIVHQQKAAKDYWSEEQAKWQLPILKAKEWKTMSFEEIERQIRKLSFVTDKEVLTYLEEIKNFVVRIKELLPELKEKIETDTAELQNKYGNLFSKTIAQLPYSSFVFKAKNKQLTLEILQKSLTTPQKVYDLAEQLGYLTKKPISRI